MGQLIGFAFIVYIVYRIMSNWKKKIDARERRLAYQQKQRKDDIEKQVLKMIEEEEADEEDEEEDEDL